MCAWASVTIAQSYYWSMDNTSIVGGGTFSTSGRTYSQKGKFGGAYYTERHPQAHLTTVSFVNSPNINLTTSGNYSLSCWVNVAAYPKSYPNCNETHIISKRANGNQFALLLLSDGQIRFGAWGSGFDIVTGPIIPLNRWVYVAVTVDYDNSIMKIYINGVEMASETLSGKPNGATGDLIFGNTDAAGDYLKQYTGAIDEVKLYNDVVLTEDVILAEASQDITPDHLWRFNDDVYEHRPIKDFTGYADLEFQGTPSLVVGKIGSSAIYFDDNADYVSTKSGITLTQNGNYSLAFWVRSVKYEGVIFNKTTGLNQISSTMHSSQDDDLGQGRWL